MDERLTIVFMPESAYGPTNNCIGIGKILEQRGHRVVFAAEASWKGKLEPLGFEEDLVDLAPPPEGDDDQDAGQFWIDFISRDRARVPQADDRAALHGHRAHLRVVDRRRHLLRAAAEGDPRSRPARRDRRGQRERVPGVDDPRRTVGTHHELQPARDEGPGTPADLQRLPDRRRRRVGGVPGRVRAVASRDLGALQRVRRRRRRPAAPRPRVHPRVRRAEPLGLPGRRRLPALTAARLHVAPPRVERARDRGAVRAAAVAP